jgi:hypothetical protein
MSARAQLIRLYGSQLDVGIVEYLLITVDDAVDLLRQIHAVA